MITNTHPHNATPPDSGPIPYLDTPLGRWAHRKHLDPTVPRDPRPKSNGGPILECPVDIATARLAAGEAFYLCDVRITSKNGGAIHVKTAGEWATPPRPGARYNIRAVYGIHARYGEQLTILDAELAVPTDEAGAAQYLADFLPGVGPTRARALLVALGPTVDQCLQALSEMPCHPDVIALIQRSGLQSRAKDIQQAAQRHIEDQQSATALARYRLTASQRRRLIAAHGGKAELAAQALDLNPYALIGTVPGFGFATVDGIAKQNGAHLDDPRRLDGAVLHTLRDLATAQGHTHLPTRAIGELAARDLDVPTAHLQSAVNRLLESGRIVGAQPDPTGKPTSYAHPEIHQAEATIAYRLCSLLDSASQHAAVPLSRPGDLTPSQRTAAERILSAPVGTLTGPPGVGKTHTLRALLDSFDAAGITSLLAAPTGKASRRMAESTGRKASTIHSMLRFNPETGGFQHDAFCPLEAGVVVVDEASMLDVELGASLLEAIDASRTRLILVGDPNQLPSVGPGYVLGDILASERIPGAELTEILRQAADSPIITNAHRILNGEMPVEHAAKRGSTASAWRHVETLDSKKGGPISPADCCEALARRVVDLFCNELPREGVSSADIQILCPQNRTPVGTHALNEAIQARINPYSEGCGQLAIGRSKLREGDRVIHTKNNRKLGVMNGEVGRITAADARQVVVSYDGENADGSPRFVEYGYDECTELQLAYAITIHKSQGSEFPWVIVPLSTSNWIMLRRSLLYTATTRAKVGVVLAGQTRALKRAVANCDDEARSTLLRQMLNDSAAL